MEHLPPKQNIHALADNSYNDNFAMQNKLFTEMFSNLVQQDRSISLETWQNLPELQQSYKTFDLFADANYTLQLIDFDNVERLQVVFDSRYKKFESWAGGADAETLPNFIGDEIEYFNKWILQSFTTKQTEINKVKNQLKKYISFVEGKLQPLASDAPAPGDAKPINLSNTGRFIWIVVNELNEQNFGDAIPTCMHYCELFKLKYTDIVRQCYKEPTKTQLKTLQLAINNNKNIPIDIVKKFNEHAILRVNKYY